MSRGRPAPWWLALCGLALLPACSAGYLNSQLAPHASLSPHAKIVVLPVTAAVSPPGSESSRGNEIAPGAEAVVTRALYETLSQQTAFDLAAQSTVEQALAASPAPPSTPAALQALARKLGAEAVLQGTITLFREREGSHVSISRPAAVGLELRMIRGRDGQPLWVGHYHEVQRSVSEEVRTLPLAWKRGFRWLTAEELADYAVTELVKTLPPVQTEKSE